MSPMAVGRALEAQLSVSVHSLRVTAHHPKHYFVVFTQPALQVNAVRRGSIKVDGAIFIVSAWHEHDHAVFDSLLLHVCVVIEGVPMHYWSVEGAEDILGKKVRVDRLDSRTLERGHTKTFACWVWTSDVANIPTKHTLAVLPRGAGRVEEMEGFSPPDRRVAPPPATADYTMLVHVDRIEDWTTPSPRSSHSGQSGLPSSDSDHDNHPVPAVTAASWTMGAEDGQRGARAQRREHAPVANTGCSGMPRRGHGREHDGDGGSRGAVQRSWKDVLLRRSRTPARKTLPGAARQRSRSPRRPKSTTQRQGGGKVAIAPPPPPPLRHRHSCGCTPAAPAAAPLQVVALEGGRERTSATRPEVADGGRREGKDPVDDFFREARRTSVASVITDPVAANVQAAAEAAVAAPLYFDGESYFDEDVDEAERVQLDAFSPTLSAATTDCGQFNRATPTAARTMEVQLGAVTSPCLPARDHRRRRQPAEAPRPFPCNGASHPRHAG
ncbi:D-3-phosphoglycerate dehydrogenase, chloroplastic [Hordeum vulgare]|nr:D-3-phosphoglycerate dehydrogenase, chloroplastic [Hordeum vulgare]